MKRLFAAVLVLGLITTLNICTYAQSVPQDYEPAPYAGPPEGSGGFFNLTGNCRQGSKPVSASTLIPVSAKITKIEGGGSGFSIVRLEKDEEKTVLAVDSAAEAEGKVIPPGQYKVYPDFPKLGEDNAGGSEVHVEVYLTAE